EPTTSTVSRHGPGSRLPWRIRVLPENLQSRSGRRRVRCLGDATDTDGGLSNNSVTCTGRWMNNVRHLRYFIAAVRRRSFRRAADELRVHQSSISRAIYQLEDNLGVSLFERRHTGV